jgi:hypothetical protein
MPCAGAGANPYDQGFSGMLSAQGLSSAQASSRGGLSDAELLAMLLRQQQQLDELKQQNRKLRKSLCQLNKKLPVCAASDNE